MDYEYAIKKIENKILNSDDDFDIFSFIYKITNENLNEYKYMLTGQNALSVVGSGDQIIEMIDNNIKNIDCFDISIFPIYYLELKLASIISLNINEYILFFLNNHDKNDDKKLKELYFDKIRLELEKKYKEFWDNLLYKYEWSKIFNSPLFSMGNIELSIAKEKNLYLNNYDNLKNKIKKINLNYYNCDIIEEYFKFTDIYDLVYLSNISDYNDILKYKSILDKIKLSENGKIITYLFRKNRYLNCFSGSNFNYFDFNKNNSSVLVYKR